MYSQALQAAVQAARRAGEILLAEFYRPGGPRGSSGHAPVDAEAEARIAQDLLSLFPDWGFRGEECSDLRRGGDHIWVVDPNDGTRAYLEGWRGSAVSIALVHQGRPVLGVVYAFAVGEGDLFTWAEGCGPVLRNGRPLSARTWPEHLSEQDVVLVSQHADHCPDFNARAVAPARFRAIPGIAWRLALVAAGEAVAAVSLSGPVDWDYAAGHALLRGAGAELYDGAGRPVGYDAQGRSFLTRCFGGPEPVVRDLAGRSWTLGRRQDSKLCWPSSQHILTDLGVLSRAQGCLLGQVAGDSLGSLVEFQRPEQILRVYPDGPRELANGGTWNTLAGQPTDDSEMALALARSILTSGGYSSGAAALAYGAWFRSGPFDVGNTTRYTLGGIPAEASPEDAEAICGRAALQVARQGGQANGSLMRISPLGVFGYALKPEALVELARRESALTHAHPVCRDACAAYVLAIAFAIRTGGSPRAVWEVARDWARDHADSAVLESISAAEQGPPARFTSQQGWVRIALQNAFYRLLHSATLEEGVVGTVACGGDTDTNAAIAGALLGAVHGRPAIPSGWESAVLSCRPLSSSPHPRPQEYWPVDVLFLAEKLAFLGRQQAG
ncbi:MAG: inositol monophosphatase family protein [Candidatus Xenobium sp.]|jgi:ADP-ribosyl-[dinitrogen reductase] hydrolase|nr:ADP-ribosylation/Crystallin J1 [Burkholderiales bacterium]